MMRAAGLGRDDACVRELLQPATGLEGLLLAEVLARLRKRPLPA
jgi:hypothetical protein